MIDVLAETGEHCLRVILEDDALPFNPLQKTLPNAEDLSRPLEERPIGELGLFLAFNSVNKYLYEFKNGRNRNIFIVNLVNRR